MVIKFDNGGMLDFFLTVPKGQICTICGVIDISNSLRHSQAIEDLIAMRFDFVGMDQNYYDDWDEDQLIYR